MPDEKHEPNRNGHFRQKLFSAAAILLLVLLAAGFGIQYLSFVSQTIYQESTSHLEEVLHKSNNMLKEMVRKNVSYLHLYNRFLESTSDADAIQAYIEKAQQDTGFVGFYFLSYDGNYMTVTCLATASQMAALLADECGTSAGEDTWVKYTWRDSISGGGVVLAEPEHYMTLR